ncbi:hypothetical protein FOA43_002947 [Brettanomyces nanus]|uniref:Uncharacterized protein n=1 Tax=Eeniella nana TaxID=13502 RepID=A0A875RPX5_EENNA|nr:uncharacterized protein FOA43_002947 [Brettanomyces nanus]QPG75590.1 hypothetical protein FOA43_002947 [Brettanomyces nanus]
MFKLLCCGSNNGYQLGVGDNNDRHVMTVSKLHSHKRIVKMASGAEHTLLILEDGKLMGCGTNGRQQLFLDSLVERSPVFETVHLLSAFKFKTIACGWEYSIAVTRDERIFVSGYGANGELGLGKDIRSSTKGYGEIMVNGENRGGVKQLKSSIHSSIIQFGNDQVWAWGNNKKGQLVDYGKNESLKIIWEPVQLEFDKGLKVIDYAMGRDFTVFIVQDEHDKLKSLFRGRDNFDIERRLASLHLSNDSFECIESMWTSIHLIDDRRRIKSIGNNSYGQTFPGTDDDSPYIHYATGSEHGLCSTHNEAFSWGWGEHGNCGEHTRGDKSVDDVTFDYLNLLYRTNGKKEKIVDVFAGCATSFIQIEETL